MIDPGRRGRPLRRSGARISGSWIAGLAIAMPLAAQADSVDAAAARVWLGDADPQVLSRLNAKGTSFEELFSALRAPPPYPRDVPRGRADLYRTDAAGTRYPYTLLVPADYDPSRAYPVLFYLHGGVARSEWTTPGGWWRDYDRIADPDRIVVVPAGWRDAAWWQDEQVDNLRAILGDVARRYHLDRDRVHLIGVSDGGTGAYYQAFRASTPWASFVSLIGHPAVLSSPRLDVDGQMHVGNLRGRPFMIVNGGRDRLYSTRSVEPFVDLFRENGVRLLYRARPEAGHDLDWWPEEAARIDSFLIATPRDPLPDTLEWEIEDTGRGRFAWIVIDELGTVPGEPDLPDRNRLRVPGEDRPYQAFPTRRPSGRVEARRSGNEVYVRTRGVRRLRLLISPLEFDLSRPIRVEVNGAARFDARVRPDRDVLLAWLAKDRDPALLFAAEIALAP